MCGICGIVNTENDHSPLSSLLSAMCQTITHRGPDDEGIHTEKHVGLGARRLSIIDIEGGHQPLSNEDGSIWAAHNGEVYNFPALREELKSLGHRFQTRTDTETIVHSYEQWGDEFVQRLRGMFATALWDRKKSRLIIIRDRVGIKPLYYTLLKDHTLVFGSELKTILKHPGVDRKIDPHALDLFLTIEYIPAPHSIFRNIHKLPAGSMLIHEKGETKITSYWNLPSRITPPEEISRLSLADCKDELYARLKESVKLRLLSDVPLGAFLSGGIDSSSIVGLMHELKASPLQTFSIGFKESSYNELDYARPIAERFNTDHKEHICSPEALSLTEKLIRHLDEPFGDFSVFPTYLVSKMARDHVKVILSGDGGDELFGGYEHYQAQKLSPRGLSSLVRTSLGRTIGALPPLERKKGWWNKLRRYIEGLDHPYGSRHLRWMTFLSQRAKNGLYSDSFRDLLEDIKPLHEIPPFPDIFRDLPVFDRTNGELYIDLKSYLVDDILVKVDRMSMATSLETRVPLLDHKVIEFVFSLPGRLKIKGLTTKWLFKKTMERLLPRENIYRKKEGFSIPMKHWLKSELKELMCDTLNEERIREDGFFNWTQIQTMISAHLQGKENFSHQLWALMVFAIWKDHYL
jgi:asparagine synthase (glutamine-hydrolysing)